MTNPERRVFAALLERLMTENADRASLGETPSIDYLSVADELHSGRINFVDPRTFSEYERSEKPVSDKGEQRKGGENTKKAEPASVDPEDISRELGLSSTRPSADLDRLRREFAFRNHPDRVPAHLRANAMIRMQVANMLIDEAKKSRPKIRASFRWKARGGGSGA